MTANRSANYYKNLNAVNAAKQRQRMQKAYDTYFKNQAEIYEQSLGLFGDTRTWKSGVYSVRGKLSSFKSGKVFLITDIGPVREKLTKFSKADQDHIKLFRSWEKLGSEKRHKWLDDYHQRIKEENEERERLARKVIADRAEKLKEMEQLKARLELTDFNLLDDGYDQIIPGETTERDLTNLLGGKSVLVGTRTKDLNGESAVLAWYAKNPKTKKEVSLMVVLQNQTVLKVNKTGF